LSENEKVRVTELRSRRDHSDLDHLQATRTVGIIIDDPGSFVVDDAVAGISGFGAGAECIRRQRTFAKRGEYQLV
jgi:hypothetical protein